MSEEKVEKGYSRLQEEHAKVSSLAAEVQCAFYLVSICSEFKSEQGKDSKMVKTNSTLLVTKIVSNLPVLSRAGNSSEATMRPFRPGSTPCRTS